MPTPQDILAGAKYNASSGLYEPQNAQIITDAIFGADPDGILASADLEDIDAGVLEDSDLLLASFDAPRYVMFSPANAGDSDADWDSDGLTADSDGTFLVIVTGLDINGDVISDTLDALADFAAGATTKTSVPFLSITSIEITFTAAAADKLEITIGWSEDLIDSVPIVVPGGDAELLFELNTTVSDSDLAMIVEVQISADGVTWFELANDEFAAITIAYEDQPQGLAIGPGRIQAGYVKLNVRPEAAIGSSSGTVNAWVGQVR